MTADRQHVAISQLCWALEELANAVDEMSLGALAGVDRAKYHIESAREMLTDTVSAK